MAGTFSQPQPNPNKTLRAGKGYLGVYISLSRIENSTESQLYVTYIDPRQFTEHPHQISML